MTIHIAEVTNENLADDQPEYLYSTRDLSFAVLPAIFASPCLLRDTDGVLRWFWRCDLTFLSWMEGLAAQNGRKMTPTMHQACDRVRCHVYHVFGITDDTADRLPAPGAALPDSALAESVRAFDAHAFPEWPGMRSFAIKRGWPVDGCGEPAPPGQPAPVPKRLRTVSM